jgi:cytochrome c biogenesis protein CcdA/thiol-disulfide isomerase/thioredoxin
MLLATLAFLGGALTIVSPCILPVLPFVFARAGQPFVRSILPLLLGMAITFAAVATLAAVGGGWAVRTNEYGRIGAMVLLALFGVMLLFPALADVLTRPLVAVGNRLAQRQTGGALGMVGTSFVLGIATGFLWAPCAGPILGLLLTGAAIQGANIGTSLLLLTFAAGAATSLALALLVGGRVFVAMKRSLGASEWVRRALGAAVLAGVAVIGLGMDTGVLTQLSLPRTASVEQALLDRLKPAPADGGAMMASAAMTSGAAMSGSNTMVASNAMVGTTASKGAASGLPVEGDMPALDGAVKWFNSPPLSPADLRGKVVLVDFWTYSCINCLRSLPYVQAWDEKYRDHGLVVIGVHAPEFAFEKSLDNVARAVRDLKITYPVAVDNNYAIWRGFDNNYWPAHYFVDASGRIRGHHFGEGDYAASEQVIQQLLAEAGNANVPQGIAKVQAGGVEAAAADADVKSPETYIGYARAQNFQPAGTERHDQPQDYLTPKSLNLNEWGLDGSWQAGEEQAVLLSAPGRITYRFHARDLHLVLGPTADGKPVRFRIQLDGAAPGMEHGVDADAQGNGAVKDHRLYQLIRQSGSARDRTFSIEFLDSGVQAYSFTFG